MKQGIRGGANASALKNTIAMRKSGYAAQTFSYLRPRRVNAPPAGWLVCPRWPIALWKPLQPYWSLADEAASNPAVAQESTPWGIA
jgi:hypothetical protein